MLDLSWILLYNNKNKSIYFIVLYKYYKLKTFGLFKFINQFINLMDIDWSITIKYIVDLEVKLS